MKHTITDIRFIDKTEEHGRHVRVTFKDGREVTICPLSTVGQKTFAQTGADTSYQLESLPVARACTKWLHGSDYKPNIQRFINKH